jgi:hypothetical protein
MRLEAIGAQHPDTVALIRGPLVLFAATEAAPRITRPQLLGARRGADGAWYAAAASGRLRLVPFTELGEERYTTYLNVV